MARPTKHTQELSDKILQYMWDNTTKETKQEIDKVYMDALVNGQGLIHIRMVDNELKYTAINMDDWLNYVKETTT